MIESTRARVTVRFTTFFAVVVIAFAMGVYWLIHQNAYWRLDGSLDATLDATRLAMLQQGNRYPDRQEGEKAIRLVLDTMARASFPQDQILVRERGQMVAYKPNIGRAQYDLRRVNVAGMPDRFNAFDLRVANTTIYIPRTKVRYVLSISTWRGDVMNDMAALWQVLGLTVPLSLLLIAGGGYYLARRTLAPLADMAATMDAITSTNMDRRIEVVRPRDEVGKLAARFNSLLERLQMSFVQQRRFMADASHELRTPVAAALTTAQVTLQETERGEAEYREALRIVEEQMLRLRRIVNDMFLLARADTRSLPVVRAQFYLDELVAEACRAMKMLAKNKGLQLSVGDLPEIGVSGDEGLLRQAVLILLDNACKYTSVGGLVAVGLERVGELAVVRVADTGPGIPKAAQPFIFDRFFRVDKSRSRLESNKNGSGAGLGLAIARWIADTHEGKVYLESSTGSGSVFVFALPVAKPSNISPANTVDVESSHIPGLEAAGKSI